jgi:serine/threonine-protein kinase
VTLRGTRVSGDHPPVLGKYKIVEVLGEGSMGVVYKAHDAAIDRYVAAKVIRKSLLGADPSGEIARRFRNEAVAAGRLSHPNIVAVYDYGESEQTAYIIMEYAQGENLESYLARNGTRPLDEAVSLTTQLLDGLHFAHERGIVHRDVKPSNVLLGADGRLKITDFGVAHVHASNLTQSGVAIGTPSYMAPEQYRGDDIDRRVDVFSAGVVLYELCTGRKPFDGRSVAELAYKICHVDAPPPSTVQVGLPPDVDALLARALAKKRDVRFATAADFARALSIALGPGGGRVSIAPSGIPASPSEATGVASGIRQASTEDLDRVARALAVHLGPIARLLVNRAAPGSRDLHDLCAGLAAHLTTDDERARFRRDAGVG